MKLTARHYFDFGADRHLVGDDLGRAEAWDRLRTATAGAFGLPDTRESWEAGARGNAELVERARRLDEILPPGAAVASYGAGTAQVELLLSSLRPGVRLLVGDYTPAAVDALRGLFPEAEVLRHDLLADPPLAADWHLFHRIDTEFDDATWRGVFGRFRRERVLVVGAGVVDTRAALRARLRSLRPPRNATRAGWLRTEAALEALWADTHAAEAVAVADLPGWQLTPRG